MAQLVAQAICNRQVVGSSPTTGSIVRFRLAGVDRIGKIPLGELRVSHVDSFTSDLEKAGYSANSRRLARVVLGGAIREARRQGLISQDPTELARPIRQDGRAYEPIDLAAFLRACESDPNGILWLAFAVTGTRRGEMLALSGVM